ncbi:unnamed protein product, partial [Laminaria digitata]
KLYVGPGWNTGIEGADPLAGFWGNDWAYALKLGSQPIDDLQISFITSYIHDWEADRNDPDITGDAARLDDRDRAVDLEPRFQGLNQTLEAKYAPEALEWLNVSGLFAFSHNDVNEEYATNAVQNSQGFSPVLYKRNEDGDPTYSQGMAGTLRIEAFDPLDTGLSFKF